MKKEAGYIFKFKCIRLLFTISLLFLFGPAVGVSMAAADENPPYVVFIMADDMGWGRCSKKISLSPTNKKPSPTPSLAFRLPGPFSLIIHLDRFEIFRVG